MFYAELTDRDNKYNDCLADFDTEDARAAFIEETNERFGYEAWKPVSKDGSSERYDLEKLHGEYPEYHELGRDIHDHIVFYIDRF